MSLPKMAWKNVGLTLATAGLMLNVVALPVYGASVEGRDTQATSQANAQTQDQDAQKLAKARTERCGRRQQAVNRRVNGLVQFNQSALNLLNTTLENVQQFVTKQNLQPENYAGLLNAAKGSKADAQTALDAIKTAPQLNCNQDDNRGDVKAYIAKVQLLNDALKDYRQNLRTLIKAVKESANPAEVGQ